MARKRKYVRTPEPWEGKTLDRLHLEEGQTVRFRKNGSKWTEGTIIGDGKDGSLTIYADGLTRAVMPEYCEKPGRGPRGGKTWEPIEA